MQAHAGRGGNWRRFTHKYRVLIFVGLCAVIAMALVGILTYMLTSMNWRVRY
jgi:hypothetical protein